MCIRDRKRDDHAVFSNAGPNLKRPEVTKIPRVVPNMYKLKKSKNNGAPRFIIETPNKGLINKTAGTIPIRVLTRAVNVKAVIISLNFKGATNKFVKFLLHISSRNNMLKLMLDLNKKSYSIAQLSITPTVLL